MSMEVRLITRRKGDSGSKSGGGGTIVSTAASTSDYAKVAALAERALDARHADNADWANEALRARHADQAEYSREAYDVAPASPAFDRWLRKDTEDSARKKITFEEGADFGPFVSGFAGAGIDGAGNGEFESIVSRSWLKVRELIYNRLNALEGDTSFADVGTIEHLAANADGTLSAVMRKRWEGDFTAFQPGDVVYGYVNNLNSASSKEHCKAWAWVKSVDRAANSLKLALYPGTETPAGVNFPLTQGMIITRWGNNIEPSADTIINPDYQPFIVKRKDGSYANTRRSSFFISCDTGNIVELMGVDKPVLKNYNYGTVLGRIPDGLLDDSTKELVNKGQPYLFARGIIVQDLIRIGYNGVPTRTANYRGMWKADSAASETDFYRATVSVYDTVTWKGSLWQCVTSQSADEPSDSNPAWLKMTNGEVKVWQLTPSASIVSVRREGVSPDSLTCAVTMSSSSSSTRTFDNNYDLLLAGAVLKYSCDGEDFKEFIMGSDEPLELEDGTDVIEAEDSVEGSSVLTLGGDDIPTEGIGDRIIFSLCDSSTHEELARVHVPVVRDGEDGRNSVSVEVTPASVVFKRDGTRQEAGVYVDVYDGGVPVSQADPGTGQTNFACTRLSATAVAAPGLIWSFDSVEGRFRYRLTFTGSVDANAEIPFTVTYKGVAYQRSITVRTVRDGQMAYPAGEYNKAITYSAEGDTTPVVMYNGNYYALRTGQTYTGTAMPPTRSNPALDVANGGEDARWMHFETFNAIFADIVLAKFAKIGSGVSWGEFMFSQYGTRRTTDDEGTVTEHADSMDYGSFDASYFDGSDQTKLPSQAPFEPHLLINWLTGRLLAQNADIRGRIATGIEGRRRIVLDPDTQQVSVYDDSDCEVITMEGRHYDDETALFGTQDGAVTMAVSQWSSSSTQDHAADIAVTQAFATAAPAEIHISGSLSCGARRGAQTASDDPYTLQVSPRASATLSVLVHTYSSGSCLEEELVETKTVATCHAQADITTGADASKSLALDRSVKVAAGFHRISVLFSRSEVGEGSQASASFSGMSARYASDFYVSRVFANGFCFGQSRNDFILGYKTPQNGMRLLLENSGYGFDFSDEHPRARAGQGRKWTPLPLLLFHGRATHSGGSYAWQGKPRSCTDSLPGFTKEGTGRVKISIPGDWPGNVSADNLIVTVNGNSAEGTLKASVASVTGSSVTVLLSKESGAADGSFIITIQYLG